MLKTSFFTKLGKYVPVRFWPMLAKIGVLTVTTLIATSPAYAASDLSNPAGLTETIVKLFAQIAAFCITLGAAGFTVFFIIRVIQGLAATGFGKSGGLSDTLMDIAKMVVCLVLMLLAIPITNEILNAASNGTGTIDVTMPKVNITGVK